MTLNVDGKKFRLINSSDAGDLQENAVFQYFQTGHRVWGIYSNDDAIAGVLFGKMDDAGNLSFDYSHYDQHGILKHGYCKSKWVISEEGLLHFQETWQWASEPTKSGHSEIVEIRDE